MLLAWKPAASSASEALREPLAVALPSSVTEPTAVPVMTAASFWPVTVTVIVCEALPSALWTLSVSVTEAPTFSACVAMALLSSVYVQAPLVLLNVKLP